MNKEGDSYRPDPSLQDSIHCIAFVIKATALLNDPRDLALRKIKALQKRMNGPRNVSFVFNTNHLQLFTYYERRVERKLKKSFSTMLMTFKNVFICRNILLNITQFFG